MPPASDPSTEAPWIDGSGDAKLGTWGSVHGNSGVDGEEKTVGIRARGDAFTRPSRGCV